MTGALSPRGRVLFRFDAGREMGGGHAMRCLGLADALNEQGIDARFAVRAEAIETLPALRAHADRIVPIANGTEIDAATVERTGADWLVIDHPDWNAAHLDAARVGTAKMLAISDSPGALDCDIVVDTTAGRTAGDYAGLVPARCAVLAGPAYALLRPEFAALRRRSLAAKQESGRRLRAYVAFGATDARGATPGALRAVSAACPDADIDVVLGAAAPCLEEVRGMAAAGKSAITLHVDTDRVAELMSRADFAVGAAGITSWERCCLALPTVAIAQADNQNPNAAALARYGAADVLADHAHVSADNIRAAASRMATDRDTRLAMARRAATLCDGLGTRRIAGRMFPELARDGRPVILHPATDADTETVFAWQARPETRRYFRSPDAPSLREHEEWFAARLADPDTLLSIVEHGGAPAGVLRLDRRGDDSWEVSILVAPERWKLGIGGAALRAGRRLLPFAALHAEVHPENAASHRLFAEAGYRRSGTGYVNDGAVPAHAES